MYFGGFGKGCSELERDGERLTISMVMRDGLGMNAFPLKLGVPGVASGLMRTSVVLKPFNELRAR